MVILKQPKSETRVTMTYPCSKSETYIEMIFTYEDEETTRTANVKIDMKYARQFAKQLQETIFSKELNSIL